MKGKRIRNLFDPASKEPYKLSRSRIDNFLSCPRCFYLDRRLGISQPSGPAFTLNSAVDHLLKKEFDLYRVKKHAHPIMEAYKVAAIPMQHEKLDEWRENFKGVRVHHEPTNLIITGAVDDLWLGENGEVMVVDYKATSKNGKISTLGDSAWAESYQRQIEIYQWLIGQQGFRVAKTGYIVYANGRKDLDAFNEQLKFEMTLIAVKGDTSWIDSTIIDAHLCLMAAELPKPSPECEYCTYRQASRLVEPADVGIPGEKALI